jgi:glycosyltransferase involved in cell wall biosynthesis
LATSPSEAHGPTAKADGATEELVDGQSFGVLIPSFNEESRIAAVIAKCKRYTSNVFVCDDGSSDLTRAIAKDMGATVLAHKTNLGYGAALRTLFEKARGSQLDIVVTLDGDGQHDPAHIPSLLRPILEDAADIVIGTRFGTKDARDKIPRVRKFGIGVITEVTNALNSTNLTDSQSGYRAYRVKDLASIMPSEMGMGASTEIVTKAAEQGLRITEVPVTVQYFSDSSTHNPFMHGLVVFLGLFKRLSITHPLLFYGLPGVILLLLGGISGILALQGFAIRGSFATTPVLLALGFSMIGFVLITTAIILWTIISLMRSAGLASP